MAREPVLVTIEMRFKSDDDTQQIADRVREAVSMIVGRDRLEDFRVREIPLSPPSPPKPRPV